LICEHAYARGSMLTHVFDLVGDHRAAFSIVLVGNQIADSARLTTGTTKRAVARRSSTLVWSTGLGIDGL
jgi:hypothetical protein